MKLPVVLLAACLGAGAAYGAGVPGELQRAFCITQDFDCDVLMNPASVARLERTRLTVSYFPLYDDGDYINYFSAAVPVLSRMTLGIARLEAGMDGIAGVDAYNRATGETYSDRLALYLLSATQAVDERLALGVNLKVADHRCLDGRDAGLGVDAGVRFAPVPTVALGASVHNLLLRPHLQPGPTEVVWPTALWGEASLRPTPYLRISAGAGLEDLFAPDGEYEDGSGVVGAWRASAAYRVMDEGTVVLAASPAEAEAGFTYRHEVFTLSYRLAYNYTLGFAYRTALELAYGPSRSEVETRAVAAGKRKKKRRNANLADRLLRKGSYWQAAREYGRTRAGRPDSLRKLSDAGLALALRGMDMHYAAEKAAAAAGPEALDAADRKGMLYTRFKRAAHARETARAEALFAQLESAGTDADDDDVMGRARYDMALLCRRTGRHERIPALLGGIGPRSGCYAYAQYWLGQIAYRDGDADKALACFDRVIGGRTRDGAGNLFRYKAQQKAGHVLFGLGRYDDAYDRYARALGGDYRRDETLIGIAWTFFRQQDFEKTMGAAEELLRKHAGSVYAAEAQLLAGYCFMVLDRYEEAVERFTSAIEGAAASGVDTAAAEADAARKRGTIRELHAELKQAEEQLVSYLTDPELLPLDDARMRLRTKIGVIGQKITGLERSIGAYRRTAVRDRAAAVVRRDAEYGLAMVEDLLKQEKIRMMKDAYEMKMRELEQMMEQAE